MFKHDLLNILAIIHGRVGQVEALLTDPVDSGKITNAREKIGALKVAIAKMDALIKEKAPKKSET